jgi:hypothetical protein
MCNFAKSQVTLSSGAAAATSVTFVVTDPVQQSQPASRAGAGGLGVILCGLLFFGYYNRNRMQGTASTIAVVVVLAACAWLAGCSGSGNRVAAPSLTYNVVITAGGGGVVQTQTVKLTIN